MSRWSWSTRSRGLSMRPWWLMGAKRGHPVRFRRQEYEPPTGTGILIEVRWKDKDGKVKKAPAQQWVRNMQTKKALDVNWVFAGSMFVKDANGQQHYVADGGDFVSVTSLARGNARPADPQQTRPQCPPVRGLRREHASRKDPGDHHLQTKIGEENRRRDGLGNAKMDAKRPEVGQGRRELGTGKRAPPARRRPRETR